MHRNRAVAIVSVAFPSWFNPVGFDILSVWLLTGMTDKDTNFFIGMLFASLFIGELLSLNGGSFRLLKTFVHMYCCVKEM